MKKRNGMIFFDVDGTLVDSKIHLVPQSTVTALHKLHENGYLVCIATGRSIQSLHQGGFDDQLFSWDGYVCNNGQMLYDQHKNRFFAKYISKEAVSACMDTASALNSPLLIETDTTMLTSEPNEYVYQAHEFFHEPVPKVKKYHGDPVIMMTAYAPKGYEYEPYRQIKGIDILPGMSSYADIVLSGFTKINGIRIMLERFSESSYIAFGDSLNDIEMFKYADISICMGDGHPQAKAAASYTTKTVMEDGILDALIKLNLISI